MDSKQTEKSWVLLIQKSPKGPFTLMEVQALINQGVVRRNDFAFKLGKDGEKTLSGWQLLCQFEEFNRRRSNSVVPNPKPQEIERRQSPPSEKKSMPPGDIPKDLADISPEDLLFRSKKDILIPSPTNDLGAKMTSEVESGPPKRNRFNVKWWYGGFAALCFGIVGIKWMGGSDVAKSPVMEINPFRESSRMPSSAPSQGTLPLAKDGGPNVPSPIITPPPPVEVPVRPRVNGDTGEIMAPQESRREDDRESELRDRGKAELDSEDDTFAREKKVKKAKKRKPAAEDDDEFSEENPSEQEEPLD